MKFNFEPPMLALLKLVKKLNLPLSGLPYLRSTIHMLDKFYHLPADLSLKEISLGGVKAQLIAPKKETSSKIIFYLHGGAFIVGLNSLYQQFADILIRLSSAKVCLIDYGIAPEHPFPLGLNQCISAYQSLLEKGIAPDDIIFMGDSAGGGLVLSTLIAARDQKIPLPSASVVFSPWVDLTLSSTHAFENEQLDPIIPVHRMNEVVALYLKEQSPAHPLASPLFADLTGLPPLFISIGTHECLCHEGHQLAEKAEAAGVSVTLHEAEGMVHVYPVLMPYHPHSRATFDKIQKFLGFNQ